MNTTEIKLKGLIKSFDDLYKYARKQFLEYERIEGIDNWEEYDFSIDCSNDQMKFKDMLQIRCIEELTEATHAMDNKDHFYEEITDAINFFLSAYCMLGVDFKEFEEVSDMLKGFNKREELPDYNECAKYFYWIVDDIGNLCNLLKNRPWTQSNYLVSMNDFNKRLHNLWETFWNIIGWLGIKEKELFEMFERKYLVNKFRIKSNY